MGVAKYFSTFGRTFFCPCFGMNRGFQVSDEKVRDFHAGTDVIFSADSGSVETFDLHSSGKIWVPA